jgi:hypothetical protein
MAILSEVKSHYGRLGLYIDMEVAKEEAFGAVAGLMRADGLEQVIE